jgi:hypothetical protein
VMSVPRVNAREQPESPVAENEGANQVAVWELTTPGNLASADAALAQERLSVEGKLSEEWNVGASDRIAAALAAARGRAG